MKSIVHDCEQLIAYAMQKNATDIHFLPHKEGMLIQLRAGGVLLLYKQVSIEDGEKMKNHFKFISGMDIGERLRPQDGACQFQTEEGYVHLRLSTLPVIVDESLAIRIHYIHHSFPLHHLSPYPETIQQMYQTMKNETGLLLFTGATGAGKSTTLYTLLHEIQRNEKKQIISFEDPIEKYMEDMIQVQINPTRGITFESGLRAALRHDPDIIMLSEIRDSETAKLAVRAAYTGHLVVGTIHAKSTAATILRLYELGVSKVDLSQSLIGVSAQRLIPIRSSTNSHHRLVREQSCLFEWLYGENLHHFIHQGFHRSTYKAMSHVAKQALRDGIITLETYERVSVQYEEKLEC